jgi:hypothetical protein
MRNLMDNDQTYTVETQTPLYTLDWYIKWVSSFVVLAAVMCRSIEEVPKIYDISLSLVGTAGWLWVGLLWHDRALILLNGVLVFVLTAGLVRYFL